MTDQQILDETIRKTESEFQQKLGRYDVYLRGIFWVLVQALQIYIGRQARKK